MVAFHKALRDNGVKADPPRGSTWVGPKDVEKAFSKFGANQTGKPELILVILPDKYVALYNLVKYQGDIVHGIHTVCVVGSKFNGPSNKGGYDLQYFANVALKINLKMGGVNQGLDAEKLDIVSQGKTMIVGIDVTHPSPGSTETAPSVAGVVASINKHLGQWPAVLGIQDPRTEMVANLGELFKSRLLLWRKHNGNVPENIIVYRDGVSEGQYDIVLKQELPKLQKSCKELYSPADIAKGLPRISIIIVGKRHHTRFYPTQVDEGSVDPKSSNSKNGTVVDRGVTEARNWDFFLQAHTALMGTARPAHYVVVYDQIFARLPVPQPFMNAADVLEDFTHNMCYMFGRATKAVSICPPAYYADLVCERARRHLSRFFEPDSDMAPSVAVANGALVVHPTLKDTMFYI